MGNDWKDIEKLVSALEQYISPGARVEHNVLLPHLDSTTGAKAQCDIVIREGSVARPVLTIVEVQSRRAQVKIGEFLGWLGKLTLVGAQRLICVSRQKFSSTIQEQAAKHGARVVLIQLRELASSELPMDFVSFHLQYRHFELLALRGLRVGACRDDLELFGVRERFWREIKSESNADEKIWSFDKETLISLGDILKSVLESAGDFSGVANYSIDMHAEYPLYICFEGVFVRVSVDVEFDCVNRLYSVPMSTLVYEQVDHGALGWVLEGYLKTDYGDIKTKMPIARAEGGMFKIRDQDIVVEGADANSMVIYELGPNTQSRS